MMEDGGVRIETKGEPQTSNNELRTSNAALTPSPSRLTREERDEGSVTLPSIHYQSAISRPLFSNIQMLLIHGENDEIFPVADCRRVAERLKSSGVAVGLRIFPGQSHNFEADRPVMVRGVAEYLRAYF